MASSPHILIVDDDPQIRNLLRHCLEAEGYRVSEAGCGKEAVQRMSSGCFDLVTLDLTLPDGNGLALGRDLRARWQVPIIMVTGKGEAVDRIVGLEIGADDYIAKPFHAREVVARVRAVLRRTEARQTLAGQGACKDAQVFGDWVFDTLKRELRSTSGEVCELTTSEFDLLKVFATHANRVLSRDQIMDLLRGHDWSPTDRSIDNLVVRLRRKLEPDQRRPSLIKTVRGVGYCFTPDTMSAA